CPARRSRRCSSWIRIPDPRSVPRKPKAAGPTACCFFCCVCCLYFGVRLLAVVGLPLAEYQLEFAEQGGDTAILRRTGIDAEADAPAALQQVADAHLGKVLPVPGTLDAVVVLPAAQAVPHGLDRRVNGRGGPVGVAMVGHHAAQVLVAVVFIFHRG